MVRNLIKIFSKEISGLHEAAYLLAFFAFLSQLLALVRDKLLAYTFGAGHLLDLYYASFRIPDVLYATIASAVSASVLVPFLLRKTKDAKDARRFIDHTFSAFFLAIALGAAVAAILAPYIVPKVLPGLSDPRSLGLLVTGTRIMLFSPILLGISNFLASVTQLYNRFLIYAISPLLYNVGIIIGTVVLYPFFGFYGLVWGVVLGAFLHMALQLPFVATKGLLPRLVFRLDWKEIREVVLVSMPRTVTLSSNELAEFFLISIATLLGAGAVSVFNFAWNLQSVPLSIIGVSYSSAAFPTLAKLYGAGDVKKYVQHIAASARHIIFWSLPVTVLFIVLRAQIVRTILGAGQFDWSDTRLTAAMLALFTVSVVGQSLILLLVRGYYAEGKTRRPLFVNVISMLLIIVLGYAFHAAFNLFPPFAFFIEALFKVDDLAGAGVLSLALAFTVGVLFNAVLHVVMFHNDYGGFKGDFTKPVLRSLFESGGASIVGGYIAYMALQLGSFYFNNQKVLGVFLQGFVAGILGIAAMIVVLKVLKSPELDDVWRTLHRNIFRAKVVVPEQETL